MSHDHVCLGQEALDLKAILLISVSGLVDGRGLLHLQLQQLLNAVLHDFPTFLHATGKGSQRLFQLRLHLLCNTLMRLAHGLDFGLDDIAGQAQCASFVGAEGFAGEIEEFA